MGWIITIIVLSVLVGGMCWGGYWLNRDLMETLFCFDDENESDDTEEEPESEDGGRMA